MCVQYIGGCSVRRGVFSTSGGGGGGGKEEMFSTLGDIMMHLGDQVGKNLSISIENPDVLNIPQCTHDIPLMYS